MKKKEQKSKKRTLLFLKKRLIVKKKNLKTIYLKEICFVHNLSNLYMFYYIHSQINMSIIGRIDWQQGLFEFSSKYV